MATPIKKSLFKHSQGGVTYYEALPDHNVSSELQRVTNPQEARDYITQLKGMGQYVPGSRTGPQFDVQGVAIQTEKALSELGQDTGAVSEWTNPRTGEVLRNIPQNQINAIMAENAQLASGQMIDLGGGRFVPKGTPTPEQSNAAFQATQPKPTYQVSGQAQLPPMETTLGQSVIKERQRVGMPVDEQAVRQAYRNYGLENSLGSWTGSAAQWKALGMEDVKYSANQLAERVKREGITDNAGNMIQPPADSYTGTNEVASPTYEYTQMSGADYQKMMDDVVSQIGTTDLAKLIADYAGGTITDPELELDKDSKDAALNELKAAAAQGLAKIQQGMAQKGMTFSSIRSDSEAALAADTLSKEAGIGREFAGKIINAARQEQGRRETALKLAETNYNKALEAQGYVYNPFTNTIEKTMEAKKFEYAQQKDILEMAKPEKPEVREIGGSLYQYNSATGNWDMTIQAPEKTYEPPTSYQEWKLAGSPGTFASFLEGKNVSKADQNALVYDTIATDAGKKLLNIAINSTDNFTNTDEFVKFRNKIKADAPLYLDDFDKKFAILLNPSDAIKIGISQADIDPMESAMLRTQLKSMRGK